MTMIYRWDIFQQLRFPYKITANRHELGNLRVGVLVYKAILVNRNDSRTRGYQRGNDPTEEHDDLENVTGIHFIDSVKTGFGPPALFLQTPLSSHFSWIEWSQLEKGCSRDRWHGLVVNATRAKYQGNEFDNIYNNLRNGSDLSLLEEACRSNVYFMHSQASWVNNSQTCDEANNIYTSLEEG